ncbi:sodium-coupled monocarboxylate transporter 1 isoform X2 [Monomorium pharaonis]|uniref:sodium-coupled monocarboxylate transporter 1 isoform X2 n=1 Tax=Monomorium pharaonis TaxID=307658 RepID=UPI001746F7D0|nr:sodium-coupled monocarboxylate transporter 1 isoform X2 [Monomorium pharaonis]
MTSGGISDHLSIANWAPEMPTVQEISESMQNFDVLDYIVFTVMLIICGIVGIYFGFIKKSSGEDEYLIGGRNMSTFPVSLSLLASFISGISLLGTPTEIYVHGTSYLFICCAIVFVSIVTHFVYLPVFHELKLTSTYEYLEKRFDKRMRLLGSVLFAIGIITWLPIVIYVPALAFNQVTGVNVHIVTPFVCIVCIFYTCVGGLKAVVWTDFFQTFIMFGSMLLITIKGTVDIGGLSLVLGRNLDSGRLEFPTSLSTGLNSMAAVVLEDFVKPFIKTPFTRKGADIFMKLTVVILGTICVALVFVVEQAGTHVLQLSISLGAITNGPSFGIFNMGMLLPWINGKGALIGGIAGLSFMGWLGLSAEAAITSGKIKFDMKPVTTEGCTYSFPQVENLLLSVPPDKSILDDVEEEPWALYRISYLWYTITGALVTMGVGLIVTLITSEDVDKLDPMLVAPFVRKYLKTSKKDIALEELQQIKVAKSNEKMASCTINEDDKLLSEATSIHNDIYKNK